MQIQDIANQILDAVEKGNVKSTSKHFTDDFRLSGAMPVAMDKDQYLDVMSKVTSAVPDWKFNRHDLRVEDQTVIIPVRVTGTQTHLLHSLQAGIPDLPPTNRSFRLPAETIRMTFRGERVSNIHLDPVPGGGIQGMLEQLGVPIPVTGRPSQKMDKGS